MVNIRKLNDMMIPDPYPHSLQSEIIANVQRCNNLAIFDAASFFYQWRLHPDYCFMFTVVTHRTQKTFQVLIMGYINSIAYIQREVDSILHAERAWANAYMDNLVCKATSVSDIFQKLCVLCEIFVAYNISIKPTKTYLDHADVGLLGQLVNPLSLRAFDHKFKANQLLRYSKTLGALRYYLRLTGYLRSYIHFYA